MKKYKTKMISSGLRILKVMGVIVGNFERNL